jgi:multidrug resistance efflux pump
MITPSQVKVWFSYACQQMPGAEQACIYLGEPDKGPFRLFDTFSDSFTHNELIHSNVDAAMKRRKSVVTRVDTDPLANENNQLLAVNAVQAVTDINSRNYLVTTPLLIDRQLYGAVSVEFKHDPAAKTQDFLKQVETAIRWLQFLSLVDSGSYASTGDAALALQITARALSEDASTAAATAVVTELATRLSCERVSIGFREGRELKLYALSHSARYEARQNLIKRIEAAIEEAVDQKETLVYPAGDNSMVMLQAHEELARNHGGQFICTVPLMHADEVTGGVIFERTREAAEFSHETIELCEQLAALFAPILEYRRLHDRPLPAKAKELMKNSVSGVFGRGYLGLKFALAMSVLIVVSLSLVQWEYRISANSVLEGTIERVIAAPEEGYIEDAPARPGDLVSAHQTLATLDDRDLQLEKLKWTGKQKQVSKEYREALASRDRSQIGILRAQLDQASAQIEILDKKLERTVITAPIDGVIVSGDFTRALGSPVERGQILYKVSPLDGYRVLLDVNETDIAELSVGMTGELTLSAAAEDTFEIIVDKITPVSVPGEGANYFQVEASLVETPEFLRPGMQGVGKIEIGQRRLLWIWTHKLVDWLRLQLWSWW